MNNPNNDDDGKRLQEYTLPAKTYENYRIIHEMIPRDDDIWIVTFPKSGTTWTLEMVWMITRNLDFESAKIPVDKRSPTLEWWFYDGEVPLELQQKNMTEVLDGIPSPRIIKTHFPWEVLPKKIRSPDSQAKIIYVARNPKDVLVSYHKYSETLGLEPTLEERFKTLTGTGFVFGPYWNHVLRFWEKRHQPNVLFLKYEDMKKDLPKVIRRVVSFLGKSPLSDTDVEKLALHLSFDQMSKNPSVNRQEYMKKYEGYKGGNFLRKGEVGSWKKELPKDMQKELSDWTESNLRGTGLTFDEM